MSISDCFRSFEGRGNRIVNAEVEAALEVLEEHDFAYHDELDARHAATR